MAKRLKSLVDTCTYTVYNFTRRGLFDAHKLIVATLLTFTVLQKDDLIPPKEMAMLLEAKKAASPPPITDELSNWLIDAQWAGLIALEEHTPFGGLVKDMEKKSELWEKWASNQLCERLHLPGEWQKSLTEFQKLLLMRAVRPDRITGALSVFVEKMMGTPYVNQDAFDAAQMFTETGPSTPIFFILFPGYSPSKDVEQLAHSMGKTSENGQLTIISMGQGQEPIAEGVLDKYTQTGGWVFLDNCHLMQGWIPVLERKLEIAAETAHKDFRCYFSAEPIAGAPFAKIVPESILQTCIKISNEPPSDMKSNMRRALNPFSQATLDRSTTEAKKVAHTAVLFALCFYHSLLLGRKKFGVGIGIGAGSGLGYCRGYSFNMGDLVNCTEVLYNYLEGNEEIPWEDLRYMFGEVFYGGHITDSMDRKLCITYLDVLVKPELLPGPNGEAPTCVLAPGFVAPPPTNYDSLKAYIETTLPAETPALYGLHSNAQLSLLTSEGEMLFSTVIEVGGGGGASGGGEGGGKEDFVRSAVEDMLERLPEEFNMIDMESRIVDKNPYVVCALQESIRMNGMISFIRRSLEELTLGLDGALNMSDAMEAVNQGILTNKVPPSWMLQMSTRVQEVFSLTAWFTYLCDMHAQLLEWTDGVIEDMPKSIWLPGMLNAKAFVTAVQQVYARANKLPLDVMKFMTEVTQMTSPEQIKERSEVGAYIHGLTLEGCRWDFQAGVLKDSIPKELRVLLPVIRVIPVNADDYNNKGYYMCPVYMNMQRANVYSAMISVFTLKTDENPDKWTLASVAILMQDELAV
uniref:Dynein heavy chain n=2 Tax=Pyramimonas obovata TaxID=1411642 RepID=A0A7S0WPT2_9CHLO|mmetsp:Transcript_33725/g.73639  ORF Transcript_33725/g.73639 Transcript_33725/m.73639 type:complete len:802 (+) Transcript_33725:51-2456(+)